MIQEIKPKKKGSQGWVAFSYFGAILACVMPLLISGPAMLLGLYYCTPQYDQKTRDNGLTITVLGILSGALGMWANQPRF